VWQIAPCTNTAISVVPAPMSTSTTPSSRSSLVSTAVLDASDEKIRSSTCKPQRCTHLLMFAAADCAQTHEMRVHFETHAGHADRVADAFLRIVQHVVARYRVQDLLVGRDCNGLRRFEHAVEIGM
jgi:hypothetical protein